MTPGPNHLREPSRPGWSRPPPRFGTGPSTTPALAAVAALAALLWACLALAAITYPPLTGRVVDQANVVSAAERDRLTAKLADLEQKSGIQLVVATVTSLQGQDIEPYANELFRTWQLGEKTKNNGVLLLVAPNEHRVRIEVGYGLEGTLTDALSRVIIANAIAPRFKAGDFDGGIRNGVSDIITVLTTDAEEWEKKPSLRLDAEPLPEWMRWLLTAALIAFLTAFFISPGFRWLVLNVLLNILLNPGPVRGGFGGGGFGGGGFGGGGFGGGGGSSGGGGASGSW
ncbi:MAG: TPM domain-containing protein [Bradyrhizobiaceae bacterium]|nr:TPM domain-containing protein [Bradyrhizobiaceae bacterium]